MTPIRVITYARVSTDMQEEGHSLDAQLNEMREFVAARPGWVIITELVDAAQSGSTTRRPSLQHLLQLVAQKAGDVILVHELSRLSRSIFDTFEIFETLGRHGVGFASVKDQNFDFSLPQGRFFLALMAAINQYYLDLLRQHTAKGKRERARKGLYNSSIAPYGYRHVGDPSTPPEIEPTEAEAIKLAFETYALSQVSYFDVAEKLNEAGYRTRTGQRFGKDVIDDMLRNPFYAGKILYGAKRKGQEPELFDGQHPPIISPELFQTCERLRQARRGSARTYHPRYNVYLLNSISVCSLCGRNLRAPGLPRQPLLPGDVPGPGLYRLSQCPGGGGGRVG
jgi:site-specific DNA recombinase